MRPLRAVLIYCPLPLEGHALVFLLRTRGYRVVAAASPEEFHLAVNESRYDACLIPWVYAFSAEAKACEQSAADAHAPSIAITAKKSAPVESTASVVIPNASPMEICEALRVAVARKRGPKRVVVPRDEDR